VLIVLTEYNSPMLKYPVIGLSPMDGVTDIVFRRIVDECSYPDVLYTEFVPVDGIILERPRLLKMLEFHKTKTPVFAQLFGNDPDNFYQVTKMLVNKGYAGIDINMGCPDEHVFKKGGGAALILKPEVAKKIILAVRKSIADNTDKKLMVTLKTRTGYDKADTYNWISHLLEVSPDIITIHGRTFFQKYSGLADWEEIRTAVKLAKNTKTKIFGNGDIKNMEMAKKIIKDYGVDGVLIGRSSLGNPWIFGSHVSTQEEKLKMMIRHCELYNKYFPEGNFKSLRKHFIWYVKSLPSSSYLKNDLMKANNVDDVKKIVDLYTSFEKNST